MGPILYGWQGRSWMDEAAQSWYFLTNDENPYNSADRLGDKRDPPGGVRPAQIRAAPVDRRRPRTRAARLHRRRPAFPRVLRHHPGDAGEGVLLARRPPSRR